MRISRTTSESLMGIWNVEKDVFECRKVCVVVMNELIECRLVVFSSLLPGNQIYDFFLCSRTGPPNVLKLRVRQEEGRVYKL